ncbi:MAG: HAD-IA family hydrolase [Acidiferrobacteraceae bacterium]
MPAAWSREVRAVLFDLDGTLADTAPDLAFALDTLLIEEGRSPLPYPSVRAQASHGTHALLALGFGINPEHADYTRLRARFLEIYGAHPSGRTTLFPGMDQVLAGLARRAIPWGIVTNKPSQLTKHVVAALGLAPHARCIVSGDTTPYQKPHPEPMLHACAQIGCAAPTCLFVGDSRRDIEAGRRAAMHTLAARFGYLRAEDDPCSWGADGVIDTPIEVLDWLGEAA